ncbi:unnamed protein product [Oreochromis niloticus]|nr:unnamed protein product [Mustela putorius furo]
MRVQEGVRKTITEFELKATDADTEAFSDTSSCRCLVWQEVVLRRCAGHATTRVLCPSISMESLAEGQNVAGEDTPAEEMIGLSNGEDSRIWQKDCVAARRRKTDKGTRISTFTQADLASRSIQLLRLSTSLSSLWTTPCLFFRSLA